MKYSIVKIIFIGLFCLCCSSSNDSEHIMNNIKDINSQTELDDYINDEKVTMAVFYKPSCPHCIKFEEIVNKVHSHYKNHPKTNIVKVEVDSSKGKSSEMIKNHEIETVPTVLVYKKGKLKKRFDSYNEYERTENNIKLAIDKAHNNHYINEKNSHKPEPA